MKKKKHFNQIKKMLKEYKLKRIVLTRDSKDFIKDISFEVKKRKT